VRGEKRAQSFRASLAILRARKFRRFNRGLARGEQEHRDEHVKESFEQCAEREQQNRADALDDIRFARLAEQWPDAVRRSREREGRPCLTINRLPAFVRQVVNDARQNKPSIKVHPADSKADPQTAEIYNGLIRNIEVTSKADVAYDTALESAASGGFGYFRIATRYSCDDSFDLDLAIDRIANPFSVYGDPHSVAADSADWNTAFVVDRIARPQFQKQYRNAEEVDWDGLGYDGLEAPWSEGKDILVAEWWSREKVKRTILLLSDQTIMGADVYLANKGLLDAMGVTVLGEREAASHKVTQRLLTGAEVLETNAWAGKFIPLVPVYGEEINLEGRRHLRSLVRDAKDPQRMFNYWRTTTTELVALAPKTPFIGPKGAFATDAAKWETANTDTHAYIEYDGAVPPQRQAFAGVPAGALQEALNASDDMKSIIGLFDASLGARSNETSGRAIIARQREGDVSTFHFIDNLSRAIEHGGRILIDLIPKVYSGERIVRVLGQDGAASSIQLGRPVPRMGPDGQPMMDQTGAALSRIFDLGAGKYDLTVETGPSYTTKREEAASQMIELLRAFPAAAPVIGDLLAKNLDWPGADEIAKRLSAMQGMQMQGQASAGQGGNNAAQQMQKQMFVLQQALSAAQSELSAAKNDRAIDARKLEIDAYKAETDRMKIVNDARREALKSAPAPVMAR